MTSTRYVLRAFNQSLRSSRPSPHQTLSYCISTSRGVLSYDLCGIDRSIGKYTPMMDYIVEAKKIARMPDDFEDLREKWPSLLCEIDTWEERERERERKREPIPTWMSSLVSPRVFVRVVVLLTRRTTLSLSTVNRKKIVLLVSNHLLASLINWFHRNDSISFSEKHQASFARFDQSLKNCWRHRPRSFSLLSLSLSLRASPSMIEDASIRRTRILLRYIDVV